MRIPWSIVFISSIFVFGVCLYLGVKNKSFTQQPTPKELSQAVIDWQRSHPKLPERQTPLPAPSSTEEHIEVGHLEPSSKALDQTSPTNTSPKLATGDIITRPSLDHFARLDYSHQQLYPLAQQLQQDGHTTHALLAWERLLDTFPYDEALHQAALKEITLLRKVNPPWNLDPSAALPITLHFTVPVSHIEACSPVFQLFSAAIEDASGYTVKATIRLIKVTQRKDLPLPPISMWCSAGDHETPHLSFQILKTEPKQLAQQAQRNLYQIIQQYIDQHTALVTPIKLSPEEDPAIALRTKLTRLSWRTFAQSLTQGSSSAPAAIPIEE